MMNDLISRQAAIDAVDVDNLHRGIVEALQNIISELPSAEPELDEWCTDCKEYDHERHCCPRWNRVIRETLKDAERKPGRWERHYSRPGVYADLYWHCSCCGYKNENQYANVYHKFCPNCGFPMEVDEE